MFEFFDRFLVNFRIRLLNCVKTSYLCLSLFANYLAGPIVFNINFGISSKRMRFYSVSLWGRMISLFYFLIMFSELYPYTNYFDKCDISHILPASDSQSCTKDGGL